MAGNGKQLERVLIHLILFSRKSVHIPDHALPSSDLFASVELDRSHTCTGSSPKGISADANLVEAILTRWCSKYSEPETFDTLF